MGYLSLHDYGVIGNQASAALVSRLGSIDWCCFPFLDSPSHFGAILDDNQGGRFQIVPQGDFRSEQRYFQRTHVLETVFETPNGRAVLTDWMPVHRSSAPDGKGHGNGGSDGASADAVIQRQLEIIDGRIQWTLVCVPRFNYGAEPARAERYRGGILFRGGEGSGQIAHLRSDLPMEIAQNGNSVQARFTLESGGRARFVWAWGRRSEVPGFADPKDSIEWWRKWAHRCSPTGCPFSGPWHDMVTRAGLTLKLLLAPYSGGIAEAVTTSIPGVPGESRTWDFRYAWIRESAMAIQALSALGYQRESEGFFTWICDLVERDGADNLQPVYTLDGGRLLPERELEYLAGYQHSKPVRVGNRSSGQFHLDIYGHVLLAGAEHLASFGKIPERVLPSFAEIAEYLCQAWRRPDHGPWEVRSKPEHFVGSKLMCWVALDRAIWIHRMLGREVSPRWPQERDILFRAICDQGYDSARNTFVRSFSDRELDASALLIPLVGFLPPTDPRVLGTLSAVQAELGQGAFIHRYRASDGVPGNDGAHLQSSFTYVTCLALCGQIDEAADRLAELCTYATPLGLFGEQLEFASGETSGNFPSASVLVSLINASLYVGLSRGRKPTLEHLLGRALPESLSRKGRAA